MQTPPARPPRDPRARRPTLWPAIAAYLVAFVLAFGSGAVVVLLAGGVRAGWEASRIGAEAAAFALSAPGLMSVASVDAFVLVVVSIVAAKLAGGSLADRLRLRPTRATPLGIAAAIVGLAGLSVAAGTASAMAGWGREGVMEVLARSLERAGPCRTFVAVATIAIAPGVAEEAFFRGLIQTRLSARFGRWPAIVATAIAFGVFHLDPVQGALAVLAGLLLGWIAERFDGIRPGVAAHAVNNAIFVSFASLAPSHDEPASRVAQAATIAAGALACAGCVAVLRSKRSLRSR